MQVVNFTDLMKFYHQIASSLLTSSSYIISVKIRLDPTWYLQTCCKLLKQYASILWIKSLDNQLVLSQLTNCSRLVIIKSEQVMWTHPDIQTCCNLDVPGCVAIVINITFLYNHPLKYNLIATLTCEVIPISPIQITCIQLIQLRLSFQNRKLLTTSVQGIMDYCLFRPGYWGNYVCSKSICRSKFPCEPLMLFQTNNFEFRGENRQ